MSDDTQKGFSSSCLLLFAILLWLLFTFILLSNKKNKMNRWSFISGFFFTGGVLKEYLYFSLVPWLLNCFPFMKEEVYTAVYSVMTALLYYLAMPSVIMVSFYFAEIPQSYPAFFKMIKFLIFLPAVLFGLVIPCTQTRYYQLNSPGYYLAVSIYNWTYGSLVTILMFISLYRRRLSHNYRQMCLITVTILLPMWFWLISIFLVHCLKLYHYFKLWQWNILIIFFLLCFFIYHMFQDGIWGVKFYWESYDIQSSGNDLDNSKYITHALKNEVTKIQWCTTSLLKQASCEQEVQLEIIQRSSRHLENFVKRFNLLSREISLYSHTFYIYPVLERCIHDAKAIASDSVTFSLLCQKEARIYTDYEHFIEMIHNLLNNALEVCKENGCITVSYSIHPMKRCCILTVEDNGPGISKEACRKLFHPYYTTKSSASGHLGLGLYYCYRVMEMQGGGIRVKSIETQGSTFFLYFPYHKSKYNSLSDTAFRAYQKLQNEEN